MISIKDNKEYIQGVLKLSKSIYINKVFDYAELEQLVKELRLYNVMRTEYISAEALLSYVNDIGFKVIEMNEYMFINDDIEEAKRYSIKER
ncbi:hypothetical protein [Clostridium sp.]|uniref:hypothetical protein n=1 Tax=Clostridium sp. TaxID=1506 RepID=UPI0026021551|nr:hypothetical protein [Clostridium sp.]